MKTVLEWLAKPSGSSLMMAQTSGAIVSTWKGRDAAATFSATAVAVAAVKMAIQFRRRYLVLLLKGFSLRPERARACKVAVLSQAINRAARELPLTDGGCRRESKNRA